MPVVLRAAEPAEEEDPIFRAPAPAWVEALDCDAPSAGKPAGAPAEVLLSDQQDRLTPEGGDYYFRFVVKLLNAEGVRQNAEWSVAYSPEYESVTWHALKLTRGGVEQDRLPAVKFKKRQRELGFESHHMLDGQVTALTVLSDVQIGDVLEVSYTRHTANPLLHGQMSATHYFGAGYPIKRQRVVVRTPLAEPDVFTTFYLPPNTQKLPDALYNPAQLRLALDTSETADERLHVWEARNLPAIVFDHSIPAQTAPFYPMMRSTSFRAWSQVAAWAENVFAASATLPESARTLVEKWKHDAKTPEERLRLAVRWVQDDIRYFAMEMGDHNLKPRPLAEVCSTRFGDCKDKALLLSTLLRDLGFEAWPALVNAHLHGQVAQWAPHPFAFNHAIVAYRLDGKLRWLDATMKNRLDRHGRWAVPPYGKALIVSSDTQGLEDVVDGGSDEPDMETRDLITIDASGAAQLRTQVVIRALQADMYRDGMEAMTPAELSSRWFNFISRFYKKLEEVDPPTITDEPEGNEITIKATYRIPEYARVEGGTRSLFVYAYALRALLDAPESRRRHWPYPLVGQRFVRHRIELESPEPLAFEQHPELILTEGLDYRAEKGLAGRRLVAVHDLRVTKDFVPAEKMAEFSDSVDELLRSLATSLQSPVAKPAPKAGAEAKEPATAPGPGPAAPATATTAAP